MPSYVVVGASRGLGYGFIKYLSADRNNTVIGLVRNVSATQTQIAEDFPDRTNIHIVRGDLTDRDSLVVAVKSVSEITGGTLNVLVANAGIASGRYYPIGEDASGDPEAFDNIFHEIMDVNVLGMIHAISLFAPLIQKTVSPLRKIMVLSSWLGHPDLTLDIGVPQWSSYCMSKAALNMAVAKFQAQYRDSHIVIFAVSPGMVDTIPGDRPDEMLSSVVQFAGAVIKRYPNIRATPYTTDESVELMLKTLDTATIETFGGHMITEFGKFTWP